VLHRVPQDVGTPRQDTNLLACINLTAQSSVSECRACTLRGSHVISPRIRRRTRVGFQVATYDTSRPLVIDPVVLSYSTYLGGNSGESGAGIAVDADGKPT